MEELPATIRHYPGFKLKSSPVFGAVALQCGAPITVGCAYAVLDSILHGPRAFFPWIQVCAALSMVAPIVAVWGVGAVFVGRWRGHSGPRKMRRLFYVRATRALSTIGLCASCMSALERPTLLHMIAMPIVTVISLAILLVIIGGDDRP